METMMSRSSVLSPPSLVQQRWAAAGKNPLPSRIRASPLMRRREKKYQAAAVVTSLHEKEEEKKHCLGFKTEDVMVAGVSIAVAFMVAFTHVDSASASSGEIDLAPVEPQVVTVSGAKEVNLAKQLQAIGARMYGAFWCSHCYEQKQMFGKEALKYITYVECYPDGYRRGVKLSRACAAANIRGFPTWVINGQQYSGEQGFDKLAELSGLTAAPVMK